MTREPAADPTRRRRWLPRRLSFRTLTVLLVAVSTLPLVAFTGVVLVRFVAEQRTASERRLLQLARSQSILVEREFDASVRALMAIAESQHLEEDDLRGFYEEAQRVLPTQPAWRAIYVLSPDGRIIVDTSRQWGAPLGSVIERQSFEELVRTQKPIVGRLRRGEEGRLAFPVRVPVMRDGRMHYAITAVVTPDILGEVISRQLRRGEEWTRSIIDAGGVIAARTRDPERFVGQSATPAGRARIAQNPEAVVHGQALDGEMVYAAYSRGAQYGWTSSVAVPAAQFDAPVRETTVALATFSAVAITLTALGAWLLAGRVTQRLRETAGAAETLARGGTPEIAPSIVVEIAALGAALERSAALLAQRERERDEHLRRAEEARAGAEQARAASEAADRAKDEFLAMLGHELRNPLSPIVTALHLLQLRNVGWDREHAVIARQVQHLTRLVDDLLDVSRITRGKIDLKQETVNVRSLVDQAVEMSSPLLEEREHQLAIDVPDSGCEVVGDRSRLAQVVSNLLVNAARYTPPGGRIAVRARTEGDTVTIAVSDTGQGLSADLLPRIFDLFVQGPRTTGREQGGLGLGLTIVHQLVRLHGGTVEAVSDGEGRGSTFTVRLPVVVAEVSEVPDPLPASVPAFVPLRVLIVDDNRDACETLASVLQAKGHKVARAYDAPGALAAAESFEPSVAILDIGLPVMDGYELAARLRERLGDRAPAIIAVTGYGQQHDRARSQQEGFVAHFVKPVDIELLSRTLADLAAPAAAPV